MSENEFDKQLLKKFEEEDFAYDPAQWEKLSRKLPPTARPLWKTGKWWLPGSVAAALALLLVSVLLINPEPKSPMETATLPPVLPQQTPEPLAPVQQREQETPASPGSIIAGTTLSQQPGRPSSPARSPNASVPLPDPKPMVTATEAPQPDIALQQKEESPKELIRATPPGNEASPNKGPRNNIPAYAYAEDFSYTYPKTSLSVSGGVHYGTGNTGYALGLSAKRKIAGDFFIDGTVAMLYNNNAPVNNYNGATNYNNKARPSADQMVNAPAIQPTDAQSKQLYYVQVNPSMGYQLDKDISLSLGGDLQQMLQTTDGQEKIQLRSGANARVFPFMDLGFTAKSELNITPHIQAGMLYREGLNNLFNNTNKFVNRRYFQVQFKYTLPMN